MTRKNSKQLERIFKGVANHRRIDIIFILSKNSELSLTEISGRLKCNYKTISEHTNRLVIAGLINKRYKGRDVLHFLSPYGEKIVEILNKF